MSERFNNYEPEVKHLVLAFEKSQEKGTNQYFDVDEMEIIIDFYLETLSNYQSSVTSHQSLVNSQQINSYNALESSIAYAEYLFPEASGIKLRKAHLYTIQGRYDRSLELLLALQEHEPDNCDVQYALGTVYSALDQPRRAIQCFLNATSDGFQVGTAYGNIADEYYHIGRLEDALRYYKKALAHNHDDERSLLNLAATYDELNINRQGVDFFQLYVKKHPYCKTAWFCLGQSLMALGDTQVEALVDAVDAFQYALTIDETFFDAYVLIAECHQQLRNIPQAVSTLREALKYASDPANVLFSIATIYKEQHNYAAASVYLRQATESDPYFSDAWLNLAECYYATGDSTSAETLYQRALGMNSDSDDFWLRYADFLILSNRYKDASDLLEKGIVNADYPQPFSIRLAVCYFKTNRRNLLFSLLIDCTQNNDNLDELFLLCPEITSDLEVMNVFNSRE